MQIDEAALAPAPALEQSPVTRLRSHSQGELAAAATVPTRNALIDFPPPPPPPPLLAPHSPLKSNYDSDRTPTLDSSSHTAATAAAPLSTSSASSPHRKIVQQHRPFSQTRSHASGLVLYQQHRDSGGGAGFPFPSSAAPHHHLSPSLTTSPPPPSRSRPCSPTFTTTLASAGGHHNDSTLYNQGITFSPSGSSIQARDRLTSILYPSNTDHHNNNNNNNNNNEASSPRRLHRSLTAIPATSSQPTATVETVVAGEDRPVAQIASTPIVRAATALSAALSESNGANMPSSSRTSSGPRPGGPGTGNDKSTSRSQQQQQQQRASGPAFPTDGPGARGRVAEAAGTGRHSGQPPASASHDRDRERQREAARQAEKDNWDRTRGAGSSVLNLLDTPGNLDGMRKWTAEDVLPLLEEVEGKRFEPVEAPSPDLLLARGIADYTILPKVLGRGKFSTVFMASKNGELSAVKHTALFPHHQLISTRLLREPTLLAELPPHPNLVEVKETIRTLGHFYLVEEYLGGYVTLEALLGKFGRAKGEAIVMPLHIADTVLSQLLSAVRAIHSPLQVCHRDIKPENILVHEETLQLKLLDFGLATHYSKSEPKLTTCCGSPAFHCPEIVKALASPPGTVSYWGPEVDAWTCGVTMLRCLTGARYPLGSSHSSLRSMAIRAQRAVAQIPLSDEPGGDETLGRLIRDKIAKLMEMESAKRIKNLEEMALERDRVAEPLRGAKDFKSTSFLPTEPSHKMDLPLLSADATKSSMLSPSMPSLPSNSSTQSSGGGGSFPFGNSTDTTPGTSQRGTPASSRPPSPGLQTTANEQKLNTISPPPPRLILMNISMQPAQRVLSYIKYCLRCAGILYHSWPDSQTSALDNWSAVLGLSRPASNDGTWSPTTPLFPPAADRTDGWSHVQIFQCVIEYEEEIVEEQHEEEAGVGLGLVQSIMAAFGRRPTGGAKRSYSQPALSPSRGASTRTPTRAAGTPAGTRTPNSSSSSKTKGGPTRWLTFYMVARFPKSGRAYSRPGYSRQSTWGGKRARTGSAAATPVNELATAEEGETILNFSTPVKSHVPTSGERSPVQSQGELSLTQVKPSPDRHRGGGGEDRHGASTPSAVYGLRSGNSSNTSLPTSPSIGGPPGLTIDVKADLPRVASSTSLSARSATPTRTRRNSRPQQPQRNRVFIDLADERALAAVRKALSVGGIVDDISKEDSGHLLVARGRGGPVTAPLLEGSEPSTPTARDQHKSTSTSRSRDGRSLSYHGPSRGGRSSGPLGATAMRAVTNSDELDSPRSRSTEKRASPASGHSTTPRAGRSAGPPVGRRASAVDTLEKVPVTLRAAQQDADEQESRGRGLIRGVPLGMPTLSGASAYVASAKQAPSLLSSEPTKEESPSSDNMPRVLEDLQASLVKLCGSAAALEVSTTPLPTDALTMDTTGLRQQARTLLIDIHHRLTSGVLSPTHLGEVVSRNLFQLFASLSPAMGLVATESLGLPVVNSAIERQSTLRGLARDSLAMVARVGSAKEALVAIQERIELLLREDYDHAKKGSMSPSRGSEGSGVALPEWSGALEVASLIAILSEVLPKLQTKKVDVFLKPLCRLLAEAAKIFVRRAPGAVSQSDEQSNETSCSQVAIQLAEALTTFVNTALQWTHATEEAEEGRVPEELVAILLVSFVSLASSLPPITEGEDALKPLSEQYFLKRNPRYRLDGSHSPSQAPLKAVFKDFDITPPASNSLSHSQGIWIALQETCERLQVDLLQVAFAHRLPRSASQRGIQNGSGSDEGGEERRRESENEASAMDVTSQLGAFLLFVKLQARRRLNEVSSSVDPPSYTATEGGTAYAPIWSQGQALSLLAQSLPLLAAGLGSNPPTASSFSATRASSGGAGQLGDCALLWAMWCVESLDAGASLGEEVLLPLVQLLSTHAALSPTASSRHIAFTLLRTLLLRHTADEQMQCDLLRDLIGESPFPQLRSASIAIVRELVQQQQQRSSVKTSKEENGGASEASATGGSLLASLQDVIFLLPKPLPFQLRSEESAVATDAESAPLSAEELSKTNTYLEEQGPWLIEGLNLLYLVLSLDNKRKKTSPQEQSGDRASFSSALQLKKIETDFLGSIRSLLRLRTLRLHDAKRQQQEPNVAQSSSSTPLPSKAYPATSSSLSSPGASVRFKEEGGSEVCPANVDNEQERSVPPAIAAEPRPSTPVKCTVSTSSPSSTSPLRAGSNMHVDLLRVAMQRVEEVWPAAERTSERQQRNTAS